MKWIYDVMNIGTEFCPSSGNRIGTDGARALAECLKQNTALTQLNLEGTSNEVDLWRDSIHL